MKELIWTYGGHKKVILVRSIYEKKNIAFNFLDSHRIYSIDVVQNDHQKILLSTDRRIIGLLNAVQNKSRHL